MNWTERFSADAHAIQASEIRELLKVLADPAILSFAGGIPDADLFPLAEINRVRSIIEADPAVDRQSLQYSQTEGYAPLRDWIAASHSTAGIALARDNVLVTNGAQQSLTLLAAALIDSAAPIAVARPTYLGALQVFEARRARFVTVETDDDGILIDSLEAAFRQGVKLLYTVPDFQNPGGMTIPEDRRRQMIALAHRYGVPILEDIAYRTLYYDAPPPPTLLSLEGAFLGEGVWQTSGLVVQIGTTSKSLMPGLRVGWTVAPRDLLDKLVVLKQANDLHTATFNQMLAHELATTILEEHTDMLRGIYRARRDAMVDTLRKHLPNSAHFSAPKGGMFVWLTLPPGLDGQALLSKSLDEEKIAFVPGAAFHADGSGNNTLRLSFSTCPPEVIAEAMERLANLIKREAQRLTYL